MEFKEYKEINSSNTVEAIKYDDFKGDRSKFISDEKYEELSISEYTWGYVMKIEDEFHYISESDFLKKYEVDDQGIIKEAQPENVWELKGEQYDLKIPKDQMDKVIITIYNMCLDNKINCNLIHN